VSTRLPQLGRRGEGWVALQLLLFLAIGGSGTVGTGWPDSVASFLRVLGFVVGVAGVVLVVLGVVELGQSTLTALPRPKPTGELRQRRVYRLVRHPLYGGALLLSLAWSLATAPLALAPTALLALLFDLKARREEAWLEERYPDYAAYRSQTPKRFVPWIY
jgi:protein-S-isoprenylcysteine O-methyltransferase Ste14